MKGQYALSLISIHILQKVENRLQPDGNVDSSPVYIDSSGTSKCGAGNARSIAIKSSAVSSHPAPPLFSCTCSGRPAFGMVKTLGWRVRKLSATCLGVRPCRFAISASTLPPGTSREEGSFHVQMGSTLLLRFLDLHNKAVYAAQFPR